MKDKNTFAQNSVEPFVIFVDDETDNKTGETGLAATLATNMMLSKNGGSFTSVSPTVAEIGDGWYKVTPIAAHRDTIGPAVWRTTAPGANSVEVSHRVIDATIDVGKVSGSATAADNLKTAAEAYSVTRGLAGTALPNAAADAAGGLPISDAGGLDLDGVLSGNTPQTGDAFARLGAPAGASISADIADVPTVAEFNARTLVAADYFDPAADTVANVTTVGTATNLTNLPAIPGNWLTAAGIAASALDGKGDWSTHAATDIVTNGAITTLSGAVVNVTTVATTTANSDMRGTDSAYTGTPPTAGAVADAVWNEARADHTTAGTFGQYTGDAAMRGTDAANTTTPPTAAAIATAVLTTSMVEAYAADGAAPTLTQALLLALQHLSESSISGTTKIVKQLDGTTPAATFTLNDASAPTSITRAT